MKARNIILTLTAAAILTAPVAVLAQQGPGTCDGTGPHGKFGGPGGPAGPGNHGMLRMLPRLADKLELSQEQQDQIQAIIDTGRPELEALREQASTAREQFHEIYGIGDFDEVACRSFFESQAQLHVEMQLIGADLVSQAWAVLTLEQQEEALELIDLFRDGRGGPRHGGGKRHGGGN